MSIKRDAYEAQTFYRMVASIKCSIESEATICHKMKMMPDDEYNDIVMKLNEDDFISADEAKKLSLKVKKYTDIIDEDLDKYEQYEELFEALPDNSEELSEKDRYIYEHCLPDYVLKELGISPTTYQRVNNKHTMTPKEVDEFNTKCYEYYMDYAQYAINKLDNSTLANACYRYAELFVDDVERFSQIKGDEATLVCNVHSNNKGNCNINESLASMLSKNQVKVFVPVPQICDIKRGERFWNAVSKMHFALRRDLLQGILTNVEKTVGNNLNAIAMAFITLEVIEVERFLFGYLLNTYCPDLSSKEMARITDEYEKNALESSKEVIRSFTPTKYFYSRQNEYSTIVKTNIAIGMTRESYDCREEEDLFRFVVRKCTTYCTEILIAELSKMQALSLVEYQRCGELLSGLKNDRGLYNRSLYYTPIWVYHFTLIYSLRKVCLSTYGLYPEEDIIYHKETDRVDEKELKIVNTDEVMADESVDDTLVQEKCDEAVAKECVMEIAAKEDKKSENEENRNVIIDDALVNELKKYKSLLDQGLINDDDYDKLKKRLLQL